MKLGAYYYPGWHPCAVRDAAFPAGWSEWRLLDPVTPRFPGHRQPLQPLWGYEDESDPLVMAKKISAAVAHGLDFFTFAFYWSRGKQLLQGALERGFLPALGSSSLNFALMWANRMPRRVLPVKDREAALIDPQRLVYTDPGDFLAFIRLIGERYPTATIFAWTAPPISPSSTPPFSCASLVSIRRVRPSPRPDCGWRETGSGRCIWRPSIRCPSICRCWPGSALIQ
jgi:hypothetical protein